MIKTVGFRNRRVLGRRFERSGDTSTFWAPSRGVLTIQPYYYFSRSEVYRRMRNKPHLFNSSLYPNIVRAITFSND